MIALHWALAFARRGCQWSTNCAVLWPLVEKTYQTARCSVFFLPRVKGGADLEPDKTPISTIFRFVLTAYFFFVQILKWRCRYDNAKGLIGLTSPIL